MLISQRNTHVFAHEISHPLANKLLTESNSRVTVFTKSFAAVTGLPVDDLSYMGLRRTIVEAAGSMGDIAFFSL